MNRTAPALVSATALLALFAAGCASEPDRIRREMQMLTNQRRFDDARAVKVKHNPGGIPKTEEETVKEEMIRDVVNPKQIEFLEGQLKGSVEKFVQNREFDNARDAVWKPIPNLVPEVEKPVSELRDKLLRERINRTQFIQLTNNMAKAVAGAVARKDFAAARKAINDVRPVRVYAGDIAATLEKIRKALVDVKVPAAEAERTISVIQPVLEKLFEDTIRRAKVVGAGDAFKPDTKKYREALDDFRKTLEAQGVDSQTANRVSSAVDKIAEKALRALWRPQEDYEVLPPEAIGTTKMNEMLEEAKKALYEGTVVPAQIAHRAGELRAKVLPLVAAGRLDEARAAIHAYGVTAFPEVDDPVFAVKLGLLNARVNPAEWDVRRAALSKSVEDALARCDLKGASAAIAAEQPVPAYGAQIDKALNVAAAETARLGFDKNGAQEVVGDARNVLYDIIAPRPEAAREARIMQAYLDEVADIASERKSDDPDWSSVRKALDNAAAWLVKDDLSKDEADALMSDVLAGFKALASGTGDAGPDALTTEELNKRLSGLKADLSAKIAAAVTAMSKAAEIVDEAPSLSSEELARRLDQLRKFATAKVSPEFADKLLRDTTAAARERIEAAKAAKAAAKAEADAKASAARAEAERLRQLALEMAERAAAAVDFDARINGFVEAVSERSEPDINRVLGDGARILRLRRVGASLSRDDATSLLAAAVYMGYDDVMNLAIVLGADVDGVAAKDGLGRTPLLIALQYGFKGRAASVLEKADRKARDARGDGSLHYAVRGGNGTALVDLLRAGVSAKKTGAGGATPIVLAADLGYAGFVQALVPFSDLEKADGEGFTALLRAAQNGRLDIVRNLVAAGAELGAKTGDGDGALELAAKANAPDLLAWLLDEVKVAPTDRVVTQLVFAGNVPTLQLMVAHGARLQDARLADAVERGDFPMVKYLVNQGMDVNAEVVKAVCRKHREPGEGQNAGPNDGTYYGPDGESIAAFLREQGQRL